MIDEKKLIEAIESTGLFIAGVARGKEMIQRFLQDYKKAIIKCINEQPKVGEWIPCSGCADCKHKECEHHGKV